MCLRIRIVRFPYHTNSKIQNINGFLISPEVQTKINIRLHALIGQDPSQRLRLNQGH